MRRSLLPLAIGLLVGCQTVPLAVAPPAPPETLVTRSHTLMGTEIELAVVARPGPAVERALDAAVARIAAVETRFTTWRPSELTRLNDAAGQAVQLHPEVLAVLEESKRLCRLTQGAFDPTWKSADRVWDFQSPNPRVPDRDAALAAMARVDCARLVVDRRAGTARLGPGMAVGLGGFVKGYAVDRAARALREHGYRDFAVNAGGDLYASGRYGGDLWRVGIRHPRKAGRELAILPVSGFAVATSGDYERYFTKDGRRYHHILDPSTGYPAAGCQSVTIMARSAALADALATGVFVLGPTRGMALVVALADTEALIVAADGRTSVSPGLRRPRHPHRPI